MSEETDTLVDCLRNSQRKQFEISRKEKRYQASTIQRIGVVEKSSNILSLAAAVKKKKGVNKELLEELSQALGKSQQNVAAFLRTDGALQALCSFLTGFYFLFLFHRINCIV